MVVSRWLFAMGWSGAASLALAMAGCGHSAVESKAKAETAPKPVPVTVAPVELRPVERTVEVVGTLNGWEDVTVGCKIQGRVLKVHHDMGDRVKPGELLVELDPVDANLAVQQAQRQFQAELAKLGLKDLPTKEFDVTALPAVIQAKVALDRAKQNVARERSLNRRGAGAQQDLQNAENDEQGATAALANAVLTAQATLANARATRAAVDVSMQAKLDTEIRAPHPYALPAGVTGEIEYAVVKRSVAEGKMLKSGDPIIQLVIETPLRLWANVPERHCGEIVVGQAVRVNVASHAGMTFDGTVARINPSVDSVSRTFQVEVLVPNNRGLLRPGGFAKASILTDRSATASIVPIESVVKYAGVTKLFVVEAGKARSINVETGQEGLGWIEVTGELAKNAEVVTTGQTQLADETAVIVRKPEPESPAPVVSTAKAGTPDESKK
ncbi:efflux RND transporter periplasmic adaptor subunit [Singulisphaera acidiphila]|uniref:RND family efflux transporter, MFP subunit n=1 Tax=Singulisphaera acidiphila (strain ATCC BAA-1392 / DSM 18658 / VKM B-2454 / MOB10) TaxID=886293 RepID=L0D990_SINAD|nr:efflux RND transporter periplasmic adaptor subunit [Singulisphaera acidiphila]AGA25425.1 RND family efflux transporter, MFP subunit [Singulisphaera acidiphila DSM 18658]